MFSGPRAVETARFTEQDISKMTPVCTHTSWPILVLATVVTIFSLLHTVKARTTNGCSLTNGYKQEWDCEIRTSTDFHNLPNTTKRLSISFDVGVTPKAIYPGLFPNLPNLEHLVIDIDNINSIQAGAFQNFTSLTYLSFAPMFCVHFDEINFDKLLPNETFRGLSNLQTLDLKCTGIHQIDKGIFIGLNNLKVLNISYNEIEEIPNQVFQHCPKLNVLILSFNKFRELNTYTFKGLHNLSKLHLDECNISTIEGGTFQNMRKVKEFRITDNPLPLIRNGTFLGLSNVTTMTLSTGTYSIESGGLIGLERLYRLKIYLTRLTALSQGMFLGLNKLKYLTINSNPISLLATNFTEGLILLKELDLRNNKISTINPGAFQLSPNIKYLYLKYNKLTTITNGTFSGLFEPGLYSRLELDLSSNPWICDCNLQWLIDWVKMKFKSKIGFGLPRIQQTECSSPDNLYRKNFLKLFEIPLCPMIPMTTVTMETSTTSTTTVTRTTRPKTTQTRTTSFHQISTSTPMTPEQKPPSFNTKISSSVSSSVSTATILPVTDRDQEMTGVELIESTSHMSTASKSPVESHGEETVKTTSQEDPSGHSVLVVSAVSLSVTAVLMFTIIMLCVLKRRHSIKCLEGTRKPEAGNEDTEDIYWEIPSVRDYENIAAFSEEDPGSWENYDNDDDDDSYDDDGEARAEIAWPIRSQAANDRSNFPTLVQFHTGQNGHNTTHDDQQPVQIDELMNTINRNMVENQPQISENSQTESSKTSQHIELGQNQLDSTLGNRIPYPKHEENTDQTLMKYVSTEGQNQLDSTLATRIPYPKHEVNTDQTLMKYVSADRDEPETCEQADNGDPPTMVKVIQQQHHKPPSGGNINQEDDHVYEPVGGSSDSSTKHGTGLDVVNNGSKEDITMRNEQVTKPAFQKIKCHLVASGCTTERCIEDMAIKNEQTPKPDFKKIERHLVANGSTTRGESGLVTVKRGGSTEKNPHKLTKSEILQNILPEHLYENKALTIERRDSNPPEDDERKDMVFENDDSDLPFPPDNNYENEMIQRTNGGRGIVRDYDDDDKDIVFENDDLDLPFPPDNNYENKMIRRTNGGLGIVRDDDDDNKDIVFENEHT